MARLIDYSELEIIRDICDRIVECGGTPYYTGGFVRDEILGIRSKDLDVEVFGITSDRLAEAIKTFGNINAVGKSFGVIKLRIKEHEFDFTLPRRENRAGRGQRGFMVEPDPSMTTKEAAARRDFTFNSLMKNVVTGEVIDHFGGAADIAKGVIRHTSDYFGEDPLRVLRGMQFAGRFGWRVAPETAELCRSITDEHDEITIERVWSEWWKWASKSAFPSKGLDFLDETGWISHYPVLEKLKGVKQEEQWHPEGDVWVHTKYVCDEAAKIATRENLDEMDRGALLFASLCHDIGKPGTTFCDTGRWRSPGHCEASVGLTDKFLKSINAPMRLTRRIKEMVGEHMIHVYSKTPTMRMARRLLARLNHASIDDVMMTIEADHSGRPPLPGGLPEGAKTIREMALEMGNRIEPLILGRHLIEMGMKPGNDFGVILKDAFKAQVEGSFEDIDSGLEWVREKFINNRGDLERD